MLDKFEPTLDADVHEHAATALTDIVSISSNRPSLLMEELESEETLNHLFKYILDEVRTSLVLLFFYYFRIINSFIHFSEYIFFNVTSMCREPQPHSSTV